MAEHSQADIDIEGIGVAVIPEEAIAPLPCFETTEDGARTDIDIRTDLVEDGIAKTRDCCRSQVKRMLVRAGQSFNILLFGEDAGNDDDIIVKLEFISASRGHDKLQAGGHEALCRADIISTGFCEMLITAWLRKECKVSGQNNGGHHVPVYLCLIELPGGRFDLKREFGEQSPEHRAVKIHLAQRRNYKIDFLLISSPKLQCDPFPDYVSFIFKLWIYYNTLSYYSQL